MTSSGLISKTLSEEIAEAELTVEHLDRSSILKSGSSELFEIVFGFDPDEHRSPDKYFVHLCYSGHVAESQFVKISDQAERDTLGYVFPVTSFRSENFTNKWTSRYAAVGFRQAVTIDNLEKFSKHASFGKISGQHYLDEIIDDNLCILVLGKDNLSQAGASWLAIELFLLAQGISLVRSPADIERSWSASQWVPKLHFRNPSDLVLAEANIFIALMKGADSDSVGIARFIQLYQAFEFFIDQLFAWCVEEISAAKLSPWDLKTKLSEVTGERGRLQLLNDFCLPGLTDRSSFRNLEEECKIFLSSLSVKFDGSANWYQVLYKVRNIIVHDQLRMLRAGYSNLDGLNNCLRIAVAVLIFSFSKPADALLKLPLREVVRDFECADDSNGKGEQGSSAKPKLGFAPRLQRFLSKLKSSFG